MSRGVFYWMPLKPCETVAKQEGIGQNSRVDLYYIGSLTHTLSLQVLGSHYH